MTTRQWQIIDATMDDTVSVEAEFGDADAVIQQGNTIRTAGGKQVCVPVDDVPGVVVWPPDEQVVTVALPRTDWATVVSELERWAVVEDRGNKPDEAAISRAIRDLVLSQTDLPSRG